MNANDTNSIVKIEELTSLPEINDSDLIIVEDEEDTKKSNISALKKSFLGDYSDPNQNKFYSSKKIDELITALTILAQSKASSSELKILYERINQIVTNNPSGTKDLELIDARGGQPTLSERFEYERYISDGKYLSKIKSSLITDKFEETSYAPITVQIIPKNNIKSSTAGIIKIHSKNLWNPSDLSKGYSVTTEHMGVLDKITGVKITPVKASSSSNPYAKFFVMASPAGDYFFTTNITYSHTFNDKTNLSFVVCNVDGTEETFNFNNEEVFKFTASKAFNAVKIIFNKTNIVDGAYVVYDNLMISSEILDKYSYYYYKEVKASQYDTVNIDDDNYIISHNIPDSTLKVSYYNEKFNTEYILDMIDKLYYSINNKIDHCGLMENYGVYQFFEDDLDYNSSVLVSDAPDIYTINGTKSKQLTIGKTATNNPKIKQIIESDIETVDYATLYFYIDRTTFSEFTDKTGIKVCLSSDIPEVTIANYYYYTITKAEMVQGWNSVKRNILEFGKVGNPDSHNIQSVTIEIERNDNLNGKSLYINSIAFNQKMKPTILLAFDGTYDDSISYLYPYLKARNIPATILLNSSRTLTATVFDSLIYMMVEHGWDIGINGCSPNKELLTRDDNYRNQYMALCDSKQWIESNITKAPVSYCAPYGNLRPITVPLLKNLGIKIARTESNAYISNFTKHNFAIPCQLVGNVHTFEEIKKRIDYAIDNGVSLCLYTNDVTEYGTEISATYVLFESIISYIIEKRDKGLLDCMTFKDFYSKCVEE